MPRPLSVPETKISTVDVPNFGGGLFLNGDQDAPVNAITKSKDVELDKYGYLIPRRQLAGFLPDTVGTAYQKFPVLWEGEIFYFTLDDGKAKFCQEGDTSWTDCGGTNTLTTGSGGYPKFIRVLDNVLILNGGNGDKLAYVSLADTGFPVVKYTLVTSPAVAMTGTLTGLTTGAYSVYYAYSYSGAVGETEITPILTKSVNVTRDQWEGLTTPGSVKVTRPAGAAPAGAKFWNLYVAISATAGTIQVSDMLQLAVKLNLANFDFVDDGSLSINLGGTAPEANSTDGPKVAHGLVEDGNPILYGDIDNPYNIWIGGGGPYAMDFSVSNGGYRAEPQKGTNFYPTSIIGFRTGQGVPALTVLYSNTEGLSKQATLAQQTVNYGDQSFTIWSVTEQHYGAAGVAAPNSPVNYNGKLLFLSTDGFLSMETAEGAPNVLSLKSVSGPIDKYVRSIKNSAMPGVVGVGWNNKYMWLVPNAGFDTPRQIMVLDTNNKGIEGNGAWYALDIEANWMGVVSPQDSAAFVYVSQGKKTYRLVDSSSTFDVKNGVSVPFSTGAAGGLVGMGGAAHNVWQADVQTMFYVVGLIGDITVGVTYRNQNGKLKTKSKIYHGPVFMPGGGGGWGDTGYTYANFPQVPGYRASSLIRDTTGVLSPKDVRIPVRVDDIMNEAQWFYSTGLGFSNYKIRAVSYEGIDLGVRPDLQ